MFESICLRVLETTQSCVQRWVIQYLLIQNKQKIVLEMFFLCVMNIDQNQISTNKFQHYYILQYYDILLNHYKIVVTNSNYILLPKRLWFLIKNKIFIQNKT